MSDAETLSQQRHQAQRYLLHYLVDNPFERGTSDETRAIYDRDVTTTGKLRIELRDGEWHCQGIYWREADVWKVYCHGPHKQEMFVTVFGEEAAARLIERTLWAYWSRDHE